MSVRKWSQPAQRNRTGQAPPPACDVGRFGAAAVGDGDVADGVAGVLGVQQGVGVAPEPVAVPVEAVRGHRVDGGAAALLPDPVVAAGDLEGAVIEELGQHVDGDSGVGVALGVLSVVDLAEALVNGHFRV